MKYLAMVFVLVGCSGTSPITKTNEIYTFDVIDFTSYSSKGFLITPYLYQGKYESSGFVTLKFYPKAEIRKTVIGKPSDSLYALSAKRWIIDDIDTKTIFDTIYAESIKLGADGIMDWWHPVFNATVIS